MLAWCRRIVLACAGSWSGSAERPFARFFGPRSPAAVTAGFRPALWACACLAVLAVLSRDHHDFDPPSDIDKGRAGGAANRGLNPKDYASTEHTRSR